ncbi:glucosaminidase domain-containing protein [Clostridium sp. AL.422]|uniref:glycoside hydrolase family 73 protein n=1 Tax=Clostridium TaxID=1485 RepID=UPI00293DFB35|nr:MULTISPECIES: glucosaminidase domain-containing protein [unclassified Clostridium]MDV4152553.1 glucosaminidase domain-containing protein [Clostridium sp. AL.422]
MQYKGTYGGLNNVSKSAKDNKIKKIILILSFLITFISTLFIVAPRIINKIDNSINLSKEEIQSYIDVTDELSKSGYQLNWQEIAAINSVLNDGNFEINNENISNIANVLLKKDNEGNVIGINSFKNAIKSLKLNKESEELAKNNLERIKNNYINESLAKDRDKVGFVESISEIAYENYSDYGILPSITISQAILESGWGESTLSSGYNNLFGIKADSRWSGKKVELETKENYDDVIVGAFRAYDDFDESIKDHGKFLYENERYAANGLFEGKRYKEQAQALENAGYSTSKDEEGNLIYADKLIRVIQENNLMIYDNLVKRN